MPPYAVDPSKPAVSEPTWKRQLIEHDIKIQNVKKIMQDANLENSSFELQLMIEELQDQNQRLLFDKSLIEDAKQFGISKLAVQIKQLEQQLIHSNMEIANVKS